MNGEEDAFYSQDVQIVQYDAAAGFFTDIGEPYSFEPTPRSSSASLNRWRQPDGRSGRRS